MLISCATVTAQLICAFVFAYEDGSKIINVLSEAAVDVLSLRKKQAPEFLEEVCCIEI